MICPECGQRYSAESTVLALEIALAQIDAEVRMCASIIEREVQRSQFQQKEIRP